MRGKSVETIAYEIVQRHQKLYVPDLGRLQNDIQAVLTEEREELGLLPSPRCEDCNAELSQCGPQDEDGEPTLDCKVCDLWEKLKDERKRITALEAALRPFAKAGEYFRRGCEQDKPNRLVLLSFEDEAGTTWMHDLTVGDLRKAEFVMRGVATPSEHAFVATWGAKRIEGQAPKDLNPGDYVLATKWGDGEAWDHWAVGYFTGMSGERYLIRDAQGNNLRANGFRRAAIITPEIGAYLLENAKELEQIGTNLWTLLEKLQAGITTLA